MDPSCPSGQNLADVVAAYDTLRSGPGVDSALTRVCPASDGSYLTVLLTALQPSAAQSS
jgi:hypothetical protein